jgi:NADH dehydrogenase
MNLVVGATGLVGSEVCRRLRERGLPVRALVRPGSPREATLGGIGAEIAHGDMKDAASLEAACRDVATVVSTATSTKSRRGGDSLESVDRTGQLVLLDAARRAGVRRFVYVSLSPNLPANNPLVRYKHEVEAAVRSSGLAWTILQPSCFMEIWFGPALGWDVAGGKARVFGPGTAPVSFISALDVAEFAVLAATRPELQGRALPLGGPAPVSPLDAVAIFEEATGRRFKVQHVPVPVIKTMSLLLRPFDPITSSLMSLGAAVAKGDVIDMAQVRGEFPVKLVSVRDYAARVATA